MEYRKTARMIKEMPWGLVQAAQHLDNWVDANEKNLLRGPPVMKFALDLKHDRVSVMDIDVDPHGWHRYASEELLAVRQVTVVVQGPAKRRRAAQAAPEKAALEEAAPAVQVVVPAAPSLLGCGRCRFSAKGCTTCKASTYFSRGRSGRGRVAASPEPQVALDRPLAGGRCSGVRGRGRGGRGR